MSVAALRRLILGQPLATKQERHQRLPNILALPVFSSDALSSSAYATEEILLVLLFLGHEGFKFTLPIAIMISVLLLTVAASYRQTIHAYPSGGGAYIVATDNIGRIPGLIAAAALLIDYVLTVSVSMAAGVLAITSATNGTRFEFLSNYRIELGILFIALVTIANLRGVKESGLLFAPPTYLYIASLFLLIGVGLFRSFTHGIDPLPVHSQVPAEEIRPLTIFLLMRAFAQGCAAITGVEAISNAIPAFRPPESKNAARVMTSMALILTSLFIGLTVLAVRLNAQPDITGVEHGHVTGVEHGHVTGVKESLISVMGRHVFGNSILYYMVQAGTALILILAANTAYQDFPRLSSILARNSLAPRQLANLGDKLVFANGIVLLGIFSSLMIFLFKGEVDRLIPLYAVGVFLSFTLSQAGMVKRWLTRREPGWRTSVIFNAVGAVMTGVVLMIFVSVKFMHGAWIVVAMTPLLVIAFLKVNEHYQQVAEQLKLAGYTPPRVLRHRVLLLIPGVNRGVLTALQYAQAISQDIEAVHVEVDPKRTRYVTEAWQKWGEGTPLRVLRSPWRSIAEPVLKYVDTIIQENRLDYVTIVIPEFVTTKWWHRLLHNSTGLMLKLALLFKKNVVVTNVRYYLGATDTNEGQNQ